MMSSLVRIENHFHLLALKSRNRLRITVLGVLFSVSFISEWGSFWDSSSSSFWIPQAVSWDVPGPFPDCIRDCDLRKNSLKFKTSLGILFTVRLNPWKRFSATPHSSSCKAGVMHSALILKHIEASRRSWCRVFFLVVSVHRSQHLFVPQCRHLKDK